MAFQWLKIFSVSPFKSSTCRMRRGTNSSKAEIYRSGNRREMAQMVERFSSNEKVLGFIPGVDEFSHCWFKLLSLLVKFFCDNTKYAING